ncbi:unnamed protein product [Lymnaea stagnalis]|uniref:Uncharacterized protein n=1 Tax=Lymnaea stagnalis TaxID=6523 RepID=A0AAV2HKU0_LYMST
MQQTRMWQSVIFCLSLVCLGVSAAQHAYDFKRTVIMMEKPTIYGENVFFRGGVDYSNRENCSKEIPVDENRCNIGIRHTVHLSPVYEAANDWNYYDNYLDWTGPEPEQGKWNGVAAEGTPAIWTTDDATSPAYHPLNTYGAHYWLADLDVDCADALEGGYFELKGFFQGKWEDDLPLGKTCTGEAGSPKFESANHIVRCGYKNVFHFNSPDCLVEAL